MLPARLRLASLWVAVVARVVADWALRLAPVAEIGWLSGSNPESPTQGWHRATILAITPFILLAPLNGIASNSVPRRTVLVASAMFNLVAVILFAAFGGAWSYCLAVTAIGSAIFSPARFAVLPAASADASLPLPRVNGLFEMGTAAGIVGGIMLGWNFIGLASSVPTPESLALPLIGLNLLCLLTVIPAAFPSDVIRPERPGVAVTGFFRDIGRIFRDREAGASLLGLALYQAVATAGAGVLVGQVLTSGAGLGEMLRALLYVGCGAAAGSGMASLQGNPRRSPGLIPFGATGLLIALGWGAWSIDPAMPLPVMPCLLLGFMGGLVNVPLRAAYMAAVPADARGNAMSAMNTAIYLLTVALALLMVLMAHFVPGSMGQMVALAVLTGAGAALAWWLLLPQAMEQITEMVLTPMYHVRAFGPGRDRIPQRGPLLIVANHSNYLDPFWVFKVVPRRVTPMMTSVFYDLPIVRWLMVHIVGAIRVPVSTFRREAPELGAAVQRLKAGGCVLVFPEGMLRRQENQLLRSFGQGIWHLLREMPETPVVVCWIEGGWGGYMSYWNGPPMTNKHVDFWRRIDIGIAEPRTLDPAILADHRSTRDYLRRTCLECRQHLGLSMPEPDVCKPGVSEEEPHAINP